MNQYPVMRVRVTPSRVSIIAAIMVGLVVGSGVGVAVVPAIRVNGVQFTSLSSSPVVSGKQGVWVDTAATPRLRYDDGTNSEFVATSTALQISTTTPTISSGFGTSPSVTASNGTAAFRINIGTGGTASSGVVGLPAASNVWNCFCSDITTFGAGSFACKQLSSTTTTATVANFSDSTGAQAVWPAGDTIIVSCFGF